MYSEVWCRPAGLSSDQTLVQATPHSHSHHLETMWELWVPSVQWASDFSERCSSCHHDHLTAPCELLCECQCQCQCSVLEIVPVIVLDSAALSQPGVAPVYTAPNTTTAAVVLLLYSTWCGATTATNTNTCFCLFCNLLLQQPTQSYNICLEKNNCCSCCGCCCCCYCWSGTTWGLIKWVMFKVGIHSNKKGFKVKWWFSVFALFILL